MAKKRVFTSFDFDHDADLKTLLAEQAKKPDSPFDFTDSSIKEPMTGNWKEKVRTRIKSTDLVIVICGEHTDTAAGVSAELAIAQENKMRYFLLRGRADKTCKKPKAAKYTDTINPWTWESLKKLI